MDNFFGNLFRKGSASCDLGLLAKTVDRKKTDLKLDCGWNSFFAVAGAGMVALAVTTPALPGMVLAGLYFGGVCGVHTGVKAVYNAGQLWSLNKMGREVAAGAPEATKNRALGLSNIIMFQFLAGFALAAGAGILALGAGASVPVLALAAAAGAFGAATIAATGMREVVHDVFDRYAAVAAYRAQMQPKTPALPPATAPALAKATAPSAPFRLAVRSKIIVTADFTADKADWPEFAPG